MDGVERLMGNPGCRHLAQDAQNMQEEGRGIMSLQLLWVSLALNFLSTIGLFVQGNTHSQPGTEGEIIHETGTKTGVGG